MNEEGLFSEQGYRPLADRMRPRSLDDYLGQDHLLAQGRPLRKVLERGAIHSMVLWGPPGVGKTTLARLISSYVDARFEVVSAVLSGVKEIRAVVERAQQFRGQRKTILFVDEVHRFNKAQQDAFLPYVEDGTLVFIGATTENPSFELNNALLSRARVYLLKPLSQESLGAVALAALVDRERGLGERGLKLTDDGVLELLCRASDGDARRLLNLLEIASDLVDDNAEITREAVVEVLGESTRRFDKGGDQFYDQISAFHKSVRGSSPDGALYWFARMLDGGCDPLYVARRLLAIASEDIGNADPRAMQVALNAWDAFERLGPAEGNRAIAQAAVYCACAPKSNALYTAFKAACSQVSSGLSEEVPHHLRNAPTALMKGLGYGAEYRYAHDEEHAYAAGERYLPRSLSGQRFYEPTERGLERKISEKLQFLRELDERSDRKRGEE
ncbi:replication-associated recombination protein A [Aestuariirhabdus litorea]|uniref:Replication-associated recombination protein A n=1 Tax=Aestuariirhabdus litorea TaxID=2528527 RepID=A0A3P3VS34_9GAMM|nr:replication-associated recombination protein A [Aestuariirhabdus litorea]RRJ84788.1 replication-associated recombination protein A [Aestuariirhabdus litorea]RWW98011.1 AAA family ATPase [Endozoicomonadaceae bacterium GTF-13]